MDALLPRTSFACDVATMVISALSIFGNLLVISSVVSLKRGKWTILTMSKLSLAFSDGCLAITAFIYGVHASVADADIRLYMIIRNTLQPFFASVSYCTVCLIAIQRFYAINYPFKYLIITKRHQCSYILAMWLFLLPSTVLFVIAYVTKILTKDGVLVLILVFIVTPFLATITSTVGMMVAYFIDIKKNGVHFASDNNGTISNPRNHSKLVKTAALISIGYVITSGPPVFAILYKAVSGNSIGSIVYEIAFPLFYLTGIVDVTVYSYLDDEFRKYAKTLYDRLCCCWNNKSTTDCRVISLSVRN